MAPSISELIASLPEETSDIASPAAADVAPTVSRSSSLALPIGRFRRLTALGTLQAKIGVAYLFYWLRGWFRGADESQRRLMETHWRSALELMDSMSYLRGAVMKVGQTLANFPDVAPREYVETLERLHFDAPPMHWSLLREMVHAELGGDPEEIFAEFDRHAFAAASLGQVHRARLKSGEEVAVKIQYPGIARTIESDFRNLFLLLLPARFTRDWEFVQAQFEDFRRRLELETDYELEATHLRTMRSLFRNEDGIVVPRVYPQFSTARILTMERLEGLHLRQFIARDPSPAERNEVGRKITRACYRMLYAGRMVYVDLHPGNFLVQEDGRLGVIDFGFMLPFEGEEWELLRRSDRPFTTGRTEDRYAMVKEMFLVRDDETERLQLFDEYAQWAMKFRYLGGEFDFGDEADFRRGIELFREVVRKRYTRGRPNSLAIGRHQFAARSILHQLRAKIDVRSIAEEEVKATGWDRRDYAPGRS
jgi:aarF domain-containing kinase